MKRIICNNHFLYHTRRLFIGNSLLKLNDIYIYIITYINANLFFKIYNDLHPYIINKTLNLLSTSYKYRSLNNFFIINLKKTV